MGTNHTTYYLSIKNRFTTNEFEDSFYDSMLIYSLRHITFMGNISREIIMEALQKSLDICNKAGINSKRHFKKIFIFDEALGTLRVDWLMSKTAFNLMVTQ